jgi:uncharacterized protein YndB with AHSA1/START domain
MSLKINPALDLVLERTVDVPVAFVWDAWTKPEILKQWFCPRPWMTTEAEIDLRPGGAFRTKMQGPDGTAFDNTGCYLEVIPQARLVWTGALGPGFRPLVHDASVPFLMTAIIALESTPSGGTKYTATVLHADTTSREKHEAMGFHHGWSAAFDQLVELAQER